MMNMHHFGVRFLPKLGRGLAHGPFFSPKWGTLLTQRGCRRGDPVLRWVKNCKNWLFS